MLAVQACAQLQQSAKLSPYNVACLGLLCRNSGFDIELVAAVAAAVNIPVIASSGAGRPEHFSEVFARTRASAALAAGIFHRREVPINAVKAHMAASGIPARM